MRRELLDLAFIGNGARVVAVSDQHYSRASNILLPGRGLNMGDGWETKRSRVPNHKDWAIIRLGDRGYLYNAEIDTCHFKGNFPESVTLESCLYDGVSETTFQQERDYVRCFF